MSAILSHWQRLRRIYTSDIWKVGQLQNRSPLGSLYAVLRVVSITISGIIENKAASRAAALSFSSLLGLGPLVAITVLVAGFMLDKQDPDMAAKTLSGIIERVAPQISQLQAQGGLPSDPSATPSTIVSGAAHVATGEPPANTELVEMIDGFIAGSQNSAVGVLGALTLIIIVLQLFTSVETCFNDIWGVRRGRSWLMRVVFYWTVLTLGSVLFFAAVTGLSAGAVFNAFETKMPYGSEVVALLRFFLPAGSLLLLVGMLTLFYRGIPNTHVMWRAALLGAVTVAVLLVLNNFLAFLYLKRVVLQKSLYGSLGILPILMFGLYVFWFFVLLGGQVSYAFQNVRYRNSRAAWNTLAESMRERLSLSVLLHIARRFQDCRPPATASEIGTSLSVPNQILNECLTRLVGMELLAPVPSAGDATGTDPGYQPAKPLNRLTLAGFKRLDDNHGGDPAGPTLSLTDPLIQHYDRELDDLLEHPFFQRPLDELLAEHPIKSA